MIGEDVLYLPALELGSRIKSRKLSPVELTEAYLARIRRYDVDLNAFARSLRRSRFARQGKRSARSPAVVIGVRSTASRTAPRTSWRPRASRPPGAPLQPRVRGSIGTRP